MNSIDTSVLINAPIDLVFEFMSQPTNLHKWNSAVKRVDPLKESEHTYKMYRDLPSGPAENVIKFDVNNSTQNIIVESISGPTPFDFTYKLNQEASGTMINLHSDVHLSGFSSKLSFITLPFIKKGINHNLKTLKQILEESDD